MEKDIGTVGGLIEYLKTLPQDAAVFIGDGEVYRSREDYPDWNEDENVAFPLDSVTFRLGRKAEDIPTHESVPREFVFDEPEKIVTLVGVR